MCVGVNWIFFHHVVGILSRNEIARMLEVTVKPVEILRLWNVGVKQSLCLFIQRNHIMT